MKHWYRRPRRALLSALALFLLSAYFAADTTSAQAVPEWLSWLNFYRSAAGIAGVTENTTYSDGDWKHARYTVKTDILAHSEDPASIWYTTEGNAAASKSNVAASSSSSLTARGAIEMWMRAPFHAIGMLDPRLHTSGFGLYNESDGGYQSGAAVDVLRGRGTLPSGVTFPIAWPGNGATVPITSLANESPNPLSSCPGYTLPAGLEIILQLGAGSVTPSVTASSFSQLGGAALEHCIFHEATYTNPNASDQSLARSILSSRDAIVLIPRATLLLGPTYAVSITTNGVRYDWTFKTGTLTSPSCPVTASPGTASFGAAGGTGTVSVTAMSGCPWTAVSNTTWLSITSGASGSSNGTVTYSVAANTSSSSRTGTLTVGGQTITVTQTGAAPACTYYSISPSSVSLTAALTSGSVSVSTQIGCLWTAMSNASWLSVTAGASGSGNGAVSYLAAANTGSTARNAAITIAGQSFAVSQAGASGGGSGSFADDFARPDTAVLDNGWQEPQGDLQIKNGEMQNVSVNTYHIALAPIAGSIVNAASDFAFTQHQGTPRFGIVLRYQDPKNYYVLYRQAGGTSVLRISRVVNGVETILKAAALSNPAKDVFFRVGGSVDGNTLTLTLNGVVKLTVTDATFTGGGTGVLIGSTLSHLHRVDNFSATAQ